MNDQTAKEWGDQFADIYDELPRSELHATTAACVETLASIARGRTVLELGVGTGRVALPLAERDFKVSVIDGSEKMLERLRAKRGAERMSIVCGDFADVACDGPFDLIYVVHNTLTCLLTQAEQVRCIQNARRKLTKDGAFVVEMIVPWRALAEGSFQNVVAITDRSVNLLLGYADAAQQLLRTQLVVIDEQGTRLVPARYRYIWPSELDLMADIAGLKLEERWSSWEKHPFTADSKSQISVYRPK